MNDRCVTPISPYVSVYSAEVNKGFTVLIYEHRTDQLEVSQTIHPNWSDESCHLPPSTQDIGHNCFFNVFVQALAFRDLHSEVQCFLGRSYCNESIKDIVNTSEMVCKPNYTFLSNFPTHFHKDFVLPKRDSFDKALKRFDNHDDQNEEKTLLRSLFDHPCQLYHD